MLNPEDPKFLSIPVLIIALTLGSTPVYALRVEAKGDQQGRQGGLEELARALREIASQAGLLSREPRQTSAGLEEKGIQPDDAVQRILDFSDQHEQSTVLFLRDDRELPEGTVYRVSSIREGVVPSRKDIADHVRVVGQGGPVVLLETETQLIVAPLVFRREAAVTELIRQTSTGDVKQKKQAAKALADRDLYLNPDPYRWGYRRSEIERAIAALTALYEYPPPLRDDAFKSVIALNELLGDEAVLAGLEENYLYSPVGVTLKSNDRKQPDLPIGTGDVFLIRLAQKRVKPDDLSGAVYLLRLMENKQLALINRPPSGRTFSEVTENEDQFVRLMIGWDQAPQRGERVTIDTAYGPVVISLNAERNQLAIDYPFQERQLRENLGFKVNVYPSSLYDLGFNRLVPAVGLSVVRDFKAAYRRFYKTQQDQEAATQLRETYRALVALADPNQTESPLEAGQDSSELLNMATTALQTEKHTRFRVALAYFEDALLNKLKNGPSALVGGFDKPKTASEYVSYTQRRLVDELTALSKTAASGLEEDGTPLAVSALLEALKDPNRPGPNQASFFGRDGVLLGTRNLPLRGPDAEITGWLDQISTDIPRKGPFVSIHRRGNILEIRPIPAGGLEEEYVFAGKPRDVFDSPNQNFTWHPISGLMPNKEGNVYAVVVRPRSGEPVVPHLLRITPNPVKVAILYSDSNDFDQPADFNSGATITVYESWDGHDMKSLANGERLLLGHGGVSLKVSLEFRDQAYLAFDLNRRAPDLDISLQPLQPPSPAGGLEENLRIVVADPTPSIQRDLSKGIMAWAHRAGRQVEVLLADNISSVKAHIQSGQIGALLLSLEISPVAMRFGNFSEALDLMDEITAGNPRIPLIPVSSGVTPGLPGGRTMFVPEGTSERVVRFNTLRDSGRIRESIEVRDLLNVQGRLDAVLDQLFSADDGSAQPAPAAGLEETEWASALVVTFDPAAAPALSESRIRTLAVASTPTDARHLVGLGVDPQTIVGVVGWAGLEEADYRRVNGAIELFVTADPAAADFQQGVVSYISGLNPGTRVIAVFNENSLAGGLEELGVPGVRISRVLERRSRAQEALAVMD